MAVTLSGSARSGVRDEYVWASAALDTTGSATVSTVGRVDVVLTLTAASGTCIPVITGYATNISTDPGATLYTGVAATSHSYRIEGAYQRIGWAFSGATDVVTVCLGAGGV